MSKTQKEIEDALLAEAPKKWAEVQRHREKIQHGNSNFQRKMAELDAKHRRERVRVLDPALRDIERRLLERDSVMSELICPNCGEPDHGNKNNGLPWCFKCNTVLIKKSKIKKWMKGGSTRMLSKTESLRRDLEKLNPGLNPHEKEPKS